MKNTLHIKQLGKRKYLRRIVIAGCLLVLFCLVAWAVLSRPRPRGESGPEAEALARQMLLSVNADAWKRTGAVKFTFVNHHHLWDRRRGYSRIESGHNLVLLRIKDQTGRVWKDGVEINNKDSKSQLRDAYAQWVNDSFWLNPVVKVFDAGVTRGLVRDKNGAPHLLVEYSSGGVTPGDAYLWTPGAGSHPPTQWRMWVRVLPVGGLAATWEDWMELSTGARVSTLHSIGPFKLQLKDVAGAATLAELLGTKEDPFASLEKSQ